MLQIQNLTMIHQKDLKMMIEIFTCTINQGYKIGIIAKDGNGKSALLKWSANLDEVNAYLSISGSCVNQFEKVGYLVQFLDERSLQTSVDDYFFEKMDPADIDYP